jgi:hypothetical protein
LGHARIYPPAALRRVPSPRWPALKTFARDRARFADARKRMNESRGGTAGTFFPLDRHATATFSLIARWPIPRFCRRA